MSIEENEETALETRQATEIQTYDYGEDEGKGFEHQSSADAQVPLIILLQSLSPLVAEREIAQAGQWYNTIQERAYDRDDGFLFVPATTRHYFAEWTPRDRGSQFQGHHQPHDDVVRKAIAAGTFGNYLTPEGNQLVETFYVYGAICDDEIALGMGVVPYSRTKIRSYKRWMMRLREFVTPGGRQHPPLYAHLTRVTSMLRKNEKGTFYVPVMRASHPDGLVKSLLAPSDERFQLAKACREHVDSGQVNIDPQQEVDKSGDEEPIPF